MLNQRTVKVSTLIDSAEALLPDDAGDAVSKASVLGLGRSLVVDELDLHGLHRRDGEDGLANSGAKSAKKS